MIQALLGTSSQARLELQATALSVPQGIGRQVALV